MDCTDRNLTHIPAQLMDILSEAKILTFSANNKLILNSSMMMSFSKAEVLSMPNGGSEFTNPQLFNNNNLLKVLTFPDILVKKISARIFDPLTMLEKLVGLRLHSVPDTLLHNLSRLSALEIQTQQSKELSADMLQGNDFMVNLTLTAPNILSLPETLLQPISQSLRGLTLRLCALPSLPPLLLTRAVNIKHLEVDGCGGHLAIASPFLGKGVSDLSLRLFNLSTVHHTAVTTASNDFYIDYLSIQYSRQLTCVDDLAPARQVMEHLTIAYSSLTELAGMSPFCCSYVLYTTLP